MIYLNNANESWIVDRFRSEWYKYNKDISTNFARRSNIVWLIAPWIWKKTSRKILESKKVICTVHHIDENKFDTLEKMNFDERDQYVDVYHGISNKTSNQLRQLTSKPIITIPFWANQNVWYFISEKEKLKKKYKLELNNYFVGSFQRDTEGFDLKSPKLSKGPDQFLKAIINLKKEKENLHVILAGKRRQYLISNLEKEEIDYSYFEMVDFKILNELYNCLDLYIVTSRVEGGPQAIVESALTKTPIISTNVGIAEEILSEESIFSMENFHEAKPNVDIAEKNVQKLTIPNGFKEFREKFFINEN